ncbi:MAG: voltage-gated chloride channel protein [Ilumatobacteraceae bacterium]|nr:voltage-gated chloride channel protein [Ilumatobacteraceae bacterium]
MLRDLVARLRAATLQRVGFLRQVARWIALGALSGLLAGLSSWVFLKGLERVTEFREHGRQWLVFLLPLAGMGMGAAYHYLGGRSHEGSNLLIDQIHEPTEWVPTRMAPLVLIGTWVSHLFGASVGREGTALQMSGSLTDGMSKLLRLTPSDRRMMLIAALGGGFGAVFGVPVAGAVFALEVQSVGRLRFEPIIPTLTAALVGDRVLIALGYHHTIYAAMTPHITPWMLVRVAGAGLLFGLVAALFAGATHRLKHVMAEQVSWAPARPLMGGIVVIALVTIFGHAYQGLSLPYLARAMAGDHLSFAVFALKLLFTVVCVGTGFFGGEVTPLFVMGATLGAALALPLGLSAPVIAAVGFCAVFGAAANAPLACIIMGAELFGSGVIVPIAVGVIVAYIASGNRGIYTSQRAFGDKLGIDLGHGA